MAKKKYTVTSDEGAAYAGPEAEVGAEVSLELSEETELALIAAGWLSHTTAKKGEGK